MLLEKLIQLLKGTFHPITNRNFKMDLLIHYTIERKYGLIFSIATPLKY